MKGREDAFDGMMLPESNGNHNMVGRGSFTAVSVAFLKNILGRQGQSIEMVRLGATLQLKVEVQRPLNKLSFQPARRARGRDAGEDSER